MASRRKKKNTLRTALIIVVILLLLALGIALFLVLKEYIFPTNPVLEHFYGE